MEQPARRLLPNGALKQFTYGNGIVHTMTQNARLLPSNSLDTYGATKVIDDTYDFDANGNVLNILDQAQAGATTRGMAYDGLDRLTTAVSNATTMFGTAQFSYDPLDNLRTAALGIATNTYSYQSNKLVSLARSSGGTFAYVTDAQGNIRDDGRLTYAFDVAHRLMQTDDKLSATLKEKYRYDGLGRRVYQERPGGAQTLSIYSQAGQMLFRFDNLPSQRTREHVYLAGSLVATIDHDWPSNTVTATNYQHTDALGSPVAVTAPDRHIVERTYYTPYGLPINHAVEGVGYTGHVMDSATGLTYMQQRYYDPGIGRFLSNDPVATNANTGANFNRYWYANDNPYRFTDPDGRDACPAQENCLRSDNPKNAGGLSATLPDAAAASVNERSRRFETNQPKSERAGHIVKNSDGTYTTKVSVGSASRDNGGTTTVPVEVPKTNGVAGIHSHSNATGTMGTSNIGNGDSELLQGDQPKPFITVNKGRVMVRELVEGRLQARMLKGELRPAEAVLVQENLNHEQELIDANH